MAKNNKDTSPLAMGRQQKGSTVYKKKKKDEEKKTVANTKPQSSVSPKSYTSTTSKTPAYKNTKSVPSYAEYKANQKSGLDQHLSRQRQRNTTFATASEMMAQRQKEKTNAVPAYKGKEKSGLDQHLENTAKKKKTLPTAEDLRKQEQEKKDKAKKAAENVMNNNTSSYYGGSMQPVQTKFGKDAADTVEQSLKQAGASENRMFWESVNGITDPRIDPFYNNVVSKEEAEKGQAKIDAHIESAAKKIEDSTEELERIKEGHGWLGQRTLEAISSGVGMLTDYAWGPAALPHMFIRSTGAARGQVTKQAAAMRQRLEATGMYSKDELDEMFKDVEKWDMANAMANGGIEMASEMLFTGYGLAKKTFGAGIIDRAAGRLFGKFGGRATGGFLGRMALGTAEEITEEEVGGPLQVWAANQIYGKKFQAMNEDATKRALQAQSDYMISQIESEDHARYLASSLSSEDFYNATKESYIEAGYTEEEADHLSGLTVDYLSASLTGDTEAMEKSQSEMVNLMTSGDRSMLEKWTLQDAIDVAASTGIMTSVSGFQGSITTARQGNAIRNQIGAEGVHNVAEIAMNWSAEDSEKAQAVLDRLDSGEDITDTQVAEYVAKASKASTEAFQDEGAKWQTAQTKMKNENLLISPAMRSADGRLVLEETTQARYDQIAGDIVAKYEAEDSESDFSAEQVRLGAEIAAAMETGVITAEQINDLVMTKNVEARQIFEEETGIDLSQFNKYDKHGLKIAETNIAMRKGLFATASENLVESARLEQEAWNDEARQEMSKNLRSGMSGRGTVAVNVALENVDPRDRDLFLLTGSASRTVYNYARYTTDSWDEVKSTFKGMFKNVDMPALKAVYDSAKADKAEAESDYYGKAVSSKDNMTRHSLKEDPAYVPGKFENMSEKEKALDFEQEKLLNEVAVELGLDVVMVDTGYKINIDGNEVTVEKDDNGIYDYKTRTIYLNSDNTMDENLEWIFSHEVTHHLAVYAPDEYLKLSRFVMDRYYKANPTAFTKEIKRIQDLYKKERGQDLTPEQALEEKIANGTRSFWDDTEFRNDLTQQSPQTARSIIDAIKDLLQKLRNILTRGNIQNEEIRQGFFARIDAWDECHKLWLDAYNAARKGQAQQAIDEWQENANTQNSARYSIGYHAGDLGKSTVDDYAHQGYGRGTGHFGFGTYFVGDVDQIGQGTGYGHRPVETVDFDKYNLFKPRNFNQALKLHDALKLIDGFITEYSDFDVDDRLSIEHTERVLDNTTRINRAAEELVDEYEMDDYQWTDDSLKNKNKVDKYISERLDENDRAEIERKARQAYENEQNRSVDEEDIRNELARNYEYYNGKTDFFGRSYIEEETEEEYIESRLQDVIDIRTRNKDIPYEYYYYKQAQEDIEKSAEAWEWKDDNLGELSDRLRDALGYKHSKAEIRDALLKTEEIVKGYQTEGEWRLNAEPGLDSGATVFMKQLGYEGVDVRHISEMDNTGYGSVIYDLKDEDLARKQEIGTARFSITPAEDEEYMKAVEDGDMETARRLVNEAADRAGFRYRGYHGSNAEFTVFDPEKRGSKNWNAPSAYMGFFAAKSRSTAEAYIGLNEMDAMSLTLNEESREKMESLKSEHGYDARHEEYLGKKKAFEDQYKSEHGYDEVEQNIEAMRSRIADKSWEEDTTNEFIDKTRMILEAEWNKEHLNDMESAWYDTEDAQAYRDYEQGIIDEWEQYEIDRRGYKPNIKELFIKMDNPLIYDFKGEGRDTESFAARMAYAKDNGYDGCIFLNVEDGGDFDDIYAVFSNEQFKSADPVTYDDEGNVIPLSERFNTENPDIRWSRATDIEDLPKKGHIPKSLEKWAEEVGLDKISKWKKIKGPVIVSVRDLRSAWYEKEGRSEEGEVVNKALNEISNSLTKLVGRYRYIDLSDAINATVHYRTDAKGRPTSVILTCQVKNAEYEVNFDFTTICAKRSPMQKVLEKFIKTEGEHKDTLYDELKLDEEGMYKLRLILEQAGFEVSCKGCFVEQNRYSQQAQAKEVADTWNRILDEYASENGIEIAEHFDFPKMDINTLDYEEIDRGFERYREILKERGEKTAEAKVRALIESSPFFQRRMKASDYASVSGQTALMAIGESKEKGTNMYNLLKRGQGYAKQSVPFTAYNGEVALLPDEMKNKSLFQYLIDIGGARAQSASDFQIEYVFDYMEMVADLSARGLPMHMYTKVMDLAELFGMTGIKINLSAMCDVDASLDSEYAGLKLVNGKYEYNISDQSIDYDRAVELQKKEGYSKNIGIIMVVLSKNHMLKSLDDDDVRYIIGYHSSKMPPIVAMMSQMGDATDYTKINKTNKLNERGRELFAKAMEKAKGETELDKFKDALRIFDDMIQEESKNDKNKVRRGNEYSRYMEGYKGNTGDFNVYENLKKTNDARKTADNYIEDCMKNDLIPMYFPFAFHQNYYKIEVYDFNMYDNVTQEYAPMEAVQNIYPGLDMTKGETDTSKFMGRVEEMMNAQNRINERLSGKYEEVTDTAKRELRRSIKVTGDDYMDFSASGIDHSDLEHRADAIMTEAEKRDEAYMDAVDSDDMETAQKYVDEAARSAGMRVVNRYHGSMNADFTVFSKRKANVEGNSGAGFYFTTNEDDALRHYKDSEGADNFFKISSFADYLMQFEDEWEGVEIDSDETAKEVARQYLAQNPGMFTVYLNYKNPYVRDYHHSTNIYEKIIEDFDESLVDRDDYDDEWEYEDALIEERDTHLWEAIDDAVRWAYDYLEENYDYVDLPSSYDLVSNILMQASEETVLTWDDIANAIPVNAEVSLQNDDNIGNEVQWGSTELTRAIIEGFGYDAIEDKEVDSKFGQLSREMMTGTEHIIVFRPEQIKLSDTVTYAEDGSIIPLSQRFDPNNNDIRYSMSTVDADEDILSDGQMEYFKNSQARDALGRLVKVFHTTSRGGFTIFDPMKSQDLRSLFFASNFDVSQTYGRRDANKPINLKKARYSTWEEFEKDAIEKFGDLDEWDKNKSVEENLGIEVTLTSYERITFEEWYAMPKEDRDAELYAVSWKMPSRYNGLGSEKYKGKENWLPHYADSFDNFLGSLSFEMGRLTSQSGYYTCYLNLENPLIVDAKGHYWNDIRFSPYENSGLKSIKEDAHFIITYAESLLTHDKGELPWIDEPSGLHTKIKYRKRNSDGQWEDFVDEQDFHINETYDSRVEVSSKWLTEKMMLHWAGLGVPNSVLNDLANEYQTWGDEIAFTEGDPDIYIDENGNSLSYDDYIEGKTQSYSTRELAKYAQSVGYDGVIIKNCYDLGGQIKRGANPMSDIYIAFSSEQVKDVENRNPTKNPDMRYCIPDEDEIRDSLAFHAEDIDDIPLRNPALEAQRVRYSMDVDRFERMISDGWNERYRTYGRLLDDDSIRPHLISMMSQIMAESETGRQYKSETLEQTVKDMKVMYYMMTKGMSREFADRAWKSAERIVDNIDFNDDLYVEYKGMRDYLKKRKIQIPEELKYDESFAELIRDNEGRMRFDNEGVSIETIYKYMRKKYPELFVDELDHPVDMILQLDYVLDLTEPYRDAYTSEEYSDLVENVAETICEMVRQGEEYRSVADDLYEKFNARTKALKQRHEEAERRIRDEYRGKIEDLRQQKNEKIEEVREEEREKAQRQKERAERWKQRYEERVQKDKADKVERKERSIHKGKFKHIEKNYKELCKWVLAPTKDKNVPEEFRKSLAELLQTLDLQTENSKALEAETGHVAQKTLKMRELKDRLLAMSKSTINEDGDYTPAVFEFDANVAWWMEALSDELDGKSVDALDANQITNLDYIFTQIIRNIQRYKRVKLENRNAELYEIGDRIADFLVEKVKRDGLHKSKEGGPLGALEKINGTSLTPAYLFERMGPLKEMYDVLRHNGFDTYIRNEAMIIDRIQGILSPYYKGRIKNKPRPGSVIEDWRDDTMAQTFNLTHGPVTLSVAQMMSLYCLVKRGTQATDHITCGGIFVTPIQAGSKMARAKQKYLKGREDTSQKIVLTTEDIQEILSKLTDEQKNVADELQRLLTEDMARLGNEAHRELYGYNNFNDPNYFPIQVHGNEIATDINNIGQVMEKIKSFGPAKPVTPKARNAVVIDDIFTVVANHCNGMNLYNAYLVPITDFMKVLNYTRTYENGDSITIKDAIEQAYGKDMLKYIMNLMKDINGIKSDNRSGIVTVMNKALGTAKRTAVFGNIRVALQQPTAIVRALAVLSPKHFIPFLKVAPEKGIRQEMYKYCPIAQWKSWGYYDTYMGRDIEDVMMNNWSMSDVALAGVYGALDNWTWSVIWRAVKSEMHEAHPEMDVKSEEFLTMCGRRASEVFDKTQVVDSTFHRSDAMRSTDTAAKLFTAFMSEPTLTLNVFRAGLFDFREQWKSGDKAKASETLARTIGVIMLQAVVVSAAQAVADAWRGKDPGLPWDDDDDEEEEVGYWMRWYHNFIYNIFDQMHLENNMYLVKDVTPYINYMLSKAADHYDWNPTLRAIMGWDQDYLYSQNNLVFAGFENTANGIAQIFKKLEKGEDYDKEWYDIWQKTLSGIGTLTGFPVGTLMRDLKPIIKVVFPEALAMDALPVDITKPKKGDDDNTKSKPSSEEGEGETKEVTPLSETEMATERASEAEKIKEKYNDMSSGEEKDKKIWSSVTSFAKEQHNDEGFSDIIAEGDYAAIAQYREMYIEAGGDADYFDQRVLDMTKTAFKKSLDYNISVEDRQDQKAMYRYMMAHGVTAEEVSSEILYKSDLAKDLKVAFRFGNSDMIYESISAIVDAGMMQNDIMRLYENRNRMQLSAYKGRYKDLLKSTGSYIWPVDGVITSGYGYRDAPTSGASTYHQGIDIAAPQGTPVLACDGGVVIEAGSHGGYGNSVGIQHADGTISYYNHLYAWNVQVGDHVGQGQQIGQVGSTGVSTGPHLDFRLYKDGDYLNPEEYLNKRQ